MEQNGRNRNMGLPKGFFVIFSYVCFFFFRIIFWEAVGKYPLLPLCYQTIQNLLRLELDCLTKHVQADVTTVSGMPLAESVA